MELFVINSASGLIERPVIYRQNQICFSNRVCVSQEIFFRKRLPWSRSLAEKPQKTSRMHLYCNSLTFDWIQADSSDVNQFVFSRKYNKTLTQVCFASFTERAPPSDGVAFEKPQETS